VAQWPSIISVRLPYLLGNKIWSDGKAITKHIIKWIKSEMKCLARQDRIAVIFMTHTPHLGVVQLTSSFQWMLPKIFSMIVPHLQILIHLSDEPTTNIV